MTRTIQESELNDEYAGEKVPLFCVGWTDDADAEFKVCFEEGLSRCAVSGLREATYRYEFNLSLSFALPTPFPQEYGMTIKNRSLNRVLCEVILP